MAGIADMTEETQPTMTWEEAVRFPDVPLPPVTFGPAPE